MIKANSIACCLVLALGLTGQSSAALFDSGIPADWAVIGNAGTLGADGVVTLSPAGGVRYGYVSTASGVANVALAGVGGQGNAANGSVLRSSPFAASAGDQLKFFFNYVTTDGSGYADYAWARLLNATQSEVALLFTARTAPAGSIVPGFSMPAPTATLSPASIPIIGGGPVWSPLQGDSGECYDFGCGYTGWVQSTYELLVGGEFILEFGVTNWQDSALQSGLAFDGITVGGVSIGSPSNGVPEPHSLALLTACLGGLAAARWAGRKGGR